MNTAQVIPFKRPSQPKQEAGKNMYSDKFEQGYVMSSRLYRKEVWPFLSDAARNVYAELENRINGHNKESDFVSYSQLQGDSDIPGARLMSRPTVSKALKELIKLGVVTVVANGKQGMKSYRLNEISIKDQFTNETGVVSKPVQPVHQTGVVSKPITGVVTTHTIDRSIDSLDNNEDNAHKTFIPQNRSMLQFIEYQPRDQKFYSLKELHSLYSVQTDFIAQAKVSFPKLNDDQIYEQIKKLAQWSVTAEKRSAQKWMTTWLNWLGNFEKNQSNPKVKTTTTEKPKKAYHRFGQGVINP